MSGVSVLGLMEQDATGTPEDAYEVLGRTYRESALYIASFQAYVQLHTMRIEDDPIPVELRESRLDPPDQELLK